MRQALDYYTRLARFFPPDAPAWDDASNNKWLVSGKGALILNPPSAWAVAKRDAPQVAEQCGRTACRRDRRAASRRSLPYFWGIWNFGKNKSAAKSLLMHLSQPAAIEKLVAASGGFDLPAFANLTTLKTWAEEGPPKGTLYHYPNPHNHQILSIAAAPSPPKIAAADLYAGHHDQDDRAPSAGRADGKDAGLGRERGRRLHAQLERDRSWMEAMGLPSRNVDLALNRKVEQDFTLRPPGGGRGKVDLFEAILLKTTRDLSPDFDRVTTRWVPFWLG